MGAFERASQPPFNKFCTNCMVNSKRKIERVFRGIAKAGQRRIRMCPVCDLMEEPEEGTA